MSVAQNFLPPTGQATRKGRNARDDLDLPTPYVAPRTPQEAQVADIWQRALDLDRVGVEDDYFDLGGDSVHAVGIMIEIEEAYGLSLNLSVLLEYSTVEALAPFVGNAATSGPSSVLFPFQSHGSKTPLFLVHGRTGHIFLAPDFTVNLDRERPVYGFQARGMDGRDSPHTTIEDMVEDYVEAMRMIQPEGPYALGSFCAGGHVALAMARYLRVQGEALHPLILIDPPVVPSAKEGRIDKTISITRIRRTLRRMSVNGVFYGRDGLGYFIRIYHHFFSRRSYTLARRDPETSERFARAWASREGLDADFDASPPMASDAAEWTSYCLAKAFRQFEPGRFDGEVAAILSEDRAIWAADRDYYIRSLVNDLRVHVVGPHHGKMFREHLPEVAKTINNILRDLP